VRAGMRRKDREVTDDKKIMDIVEKCDVCRLAMNDGGFPYIVPMNFGYSMEKGRLILYFHCAKEGKKISLLGKDPHVCFEMDCGHQLTGDKAACSYSMNYESVIGNGIAEFVGDLDGKKLALAQIMKKYTKQDNFLFDEKLLDITTIFKIVSDDFTGKRHGG